MRNPTKTSGPGKRAWFFRVPCPKCKQAAGEGCFPVVHAHAARVRLASAMGFEPKANLIGLTTPKCLKKKEVKPRRGAAKGIHEAGWISGNCKASIHQNCFSLACSCSCHRGATWTP